MQDVTAVENDIELQKRSEEKEVGISRNGQPQDPVLRDTVRFAPEIFQKVDAEFLGGVRRGHSCDAQTRKEPDERAAEKDHAGIFLVPIKSLGKARSGNRSGNCGEKRAQLDDAVAPGQTVFRQNLGQQSVFRRTKQRSLGAGQEKRGERHRHVVEGEARNRKQHDRNLE